MTLPSVNDIADELILASDITAERFFRDGVCRAITSQYPWGYLVNNYYQAHNLIPEGGELTFGYLNEVRDAVFDSVITEAATDPELLDILRAFSKEHELAMSDFELKYDPDLGKFRVIMNDNALVVVTKLKDEVLSDLHKAVLVAHYGAKAVPEPDELTACIMTSAAYVVIDDDMNAFIGAGA